MDKVALPAAGTPLKCREQGLGGAVLLEEREEKRDLLLENRLEIS